MNGGRIFGWPIEEFVSAELVLRQARLGQHCAEKSLAEGSAFAVRYQSWEIVQDEDLGCRRRPANECKS